MHLVGPQGWAQIVDPLKMGPSTLVDLLEAKDSFLAAADGATSPVKAAEAHSDYRDVLAGIRAHLRFATDGDMRRAERALEPIRESLITTYFNR